MAGLLLLPSSSLCVQNRSPNHPVTIYHIRSLLRFPQWVPLPHKLKARVLTMTFRALGVLPCPPQPLRNHLVLLLHAPHPHSLGFLQRLWQVPSSLTAHLPTSLPPPKKKCSPSRLPQVFIQISPVRPHHHHPIKLFNYRPPS